MRPHHMSPPVTDVTHPLFCFSVGFLHHLKCLYQSKQHELLEVLLSPLQNIGFSVKKISARADKTMSRVSNHFPLYKSISVSTPDTLWNWRAGWRKSICLDRQSLHLTPGILDWFKWKSANLTCKWRCLSFIVFFSPWVLCMSGKW